MTQLAANHGWKAAPGCRIVVLDGGAVRFDLPRDWAIHVRESHVLVYDEAPPNTRCTLGVSWHRIPPEATWMPLSSLLEQGLVTETRKVVGNGGMHWVRRPPLELVWMQLRVVEARDGRERLTRMCLARGGCTQAVLLCEFGVEDEAAVFGVWQTLLGTLAVGDYIADAATGAKVEKRG